MKKSVLLSSAICSTVLVLTLGACTPKDASIISEKQRQELNNKNTRGGERNAQQKDLTLFYPENFSLATFLSQKNLEAIELISVAMGRSETQDSLYERSAGKARETGEQTALLLQDFKAVDFTKAEDSVRMEFSRAYDVTFSLEGQKDILTIVGQKLRSRSDLTAKKNFDVSYTEDLSLVVSKDEKDADNWIVTGTSEGTIVGAKGKDYRSVNMKVSFVLNIKASSIESSDIVITKFETTAEYPSPDGLKPWTMKVSGENFTAKTEDRCPQLIGIAKFSAGKATGKVQLSADQITINKNWVKDFASCGSRPAVDLSFLQIN